MVHGITVECMKLKFWADILSTLISQLCGSPTIAIILKTKYELKNVPNNIQHYK